MRATTPHTPLTSRENSFFKYLLSLRDAKHRRAANAFVVEGVKTVEEALRGSGDVQAVLAAPALSRHHGRGILQLARSKEIDIHWISEKLLSALSESKTPQPVMAVVGINTRAEDVLFSVPPGLLALAHQLQDPGNLGTIIRTAEAAGAAGVAVASRTVDPYNAKTIRASMGSLLRLPVIRVPDTASFLDRCKQQGFQRVGLTVAGTHTHFDLDLTRPTAIIVGQEGSGLAEDILDHVDHHVRIPMAPATESLNAAVSAAIVLYEALRQRQKPR